MENDLSVKSNDVIASVLKSIVSAIPWAGGALSEIISYSIPNQRQDRIASLVTELNNTVMKLKDDFSELKSRLEQIAKTPGQNRIIELAFQAAVETNSKIMHHCYAYYIFHNLENKSLDDIQREKIIKTISELNEYEIIHLLNFMFPSYIGNISDFFSKYESILTPRPNYMGSPDEDIEFNAFFNQYKITLEQKGLIIGKPEIKNGVMNFDKKNYSITSFGRIVAGAIYDEDFFK